MSGSIPWSPGTAKAKLQYIEIIFLSFLPMLFCPVQPTSLSQLITGYRNFYFQIFLQKCLFSQKAWRDQWSKCQVKNAELHVCAGGRKASCEEGILQKDREEDSSCCFTCFISLLHMLKWRHRNTADAFSSAETNTNMLLLSCKPLGTVDLRRRPLLVWISLPDDTNICSPSSPFSLLRSVLPHGL